MSILMGDNVNLQNNSITNVTSETISGNLSTSTLTVTNSGSGDAVTVTNSSTGYGINVTSAGAAAIKAVCNGFDVAGNFSSPSGTGITVSGGISGVNSTGKITSSVSSGAAFYSNNGYGDFTALYLNSKPVKGTWANRPSSPADGDDYLATDYASHYIYQSSLFSGPAANWYKITNAGLTDTFTRSDSTTTLGKAESGNGWMPYSGTWGISSNQAYTVSDAGGDIALIQTYLCDYVAQIQINGNLNSTTNFRYPALVLNGLDASNFLLIVLGGGTLKLRKSDAGTISDLSSVTVTTSDSTNYTITVVKIGFSISIYLNSTLQINNYVLGSTTTTDVKYANYTLAGMRLAKSGTPTVAARWDNFQIRQPA